METEKEKTRPDRDVEIAPVVQPVPERTIRVFPDPDRLPIPAKNVADQ